MFQAPLVVMVCGVTQWILVTLLAISFSGNYPWWALGIGGAGGLGIGIYLWRQTGTSSAAPKVTHPPGNFPSRLYQYEFLAQSPALLILFFANHLPAFLLPLSLVWLVVIWGGRKMAGRPFLPGTPLDLPLLLLLIPSLTSLYAAVDLRQSENAVCMLIAGITLGYGLFGTLNTERRIHWAFMLFLGVGALAALSGLLVMQLPQSKLPLVSSLYGSLPELLPRRIHPNYLGGTLAFFFPAAFWGLALKYRPRIWMGLAAGSIGVGLFLTQSRGALLATVVAMVLVGACWNRWIRWGLPVVAVILGLSAYILGGDVFLDPAAGNEVVQSLGSRQEIWQRAVYITQDFPFTGIGMRSFPVVVDMLYPLFLAGPNAKVPHAHNLYLDTAAALGFPGLVAFCAVLGAWGGMIGEVLARSRQNPEMRSEWIMGLGMAGGMIAHLLYGITDTIALGEKAGLVFWAVLGMTAALWKRVRLETDPGRVANTIGPLH